MADDAAGLGWRLLARVLDAVLVGLPASIVVAILGLPAPTLALGGLDAWLPGAVTGLLWWGYYFVLEGTTGTTLGKRMLRLRVHAADGAPPSPVAAAVRNLWLLFGLVPLVGGLGQLAAVVVIAVTVGRDDARRGTHDRIAGTMVTRSPPR